MEIFSYSWPVKRKFMEWKSFSSRNLRGKSFCNMKWSKKMNKNKSIIQLKETTSCYKLRKISHQNPSLSLNCTRLCLWQIKKKYSSLFLKVLESSSLPQISLKPQSRFPTSDTLLTPDRKSTDTSTKSGSGKKGGAAKPWPNKDPVEPVEQLMVTATDSIRQPFMPTLWKTIQPHKF